MGCRTFGVVALGVLLQAFPSLSSAAEIGQGEVYSVVDIAFRGPLQDAQDSPARDIQLSATLKHESGEEVTIHGFHAGGDVFKIRFCPTKPGRWEIAAVTCNAKELNAQHQGDHVTAAASQRHGFWLADENSPGRRWYRRSDGSHQYIFGNTHYSFLSGMKDDGPCGNEIAADIAANARYFKKLRFTFMGDRYPHPTEKPFLDDSGRPTDAGDYSHRPNPKWFAERADVAVQAALKHDLIADLILCGPDVEDARATLRAAANSGDATPYLRYVAARYGSFPNVWLCLCNEYEIKKPLWSEAEAAAFGESIKKFLPYATPLSIHASQHPDKGPRTDDRPAWATKFDSLPPWNDHQIIQRKLKTIAAAADVNARTWKSPGPTPRNKPTINDELSYTGLGDKHSGEDTIEAHLGAFLGGGYGSTGEKRGNKLGHYFWGKFDAQEHKSAVNLGWLRERIDKHVTFWKMAPDTTAFPNLDPAFRAMAWPGSEYVLGTDKQAEVTAMLPEGTWTVRRFDAIDMKDELLSANASGRYSFVSPESRAVLFHLKRNP